MKEKLIPGCEDFCEDCRSRYAVSDYDGADGTYLIYYECGDQEDCDELKTEAAKIAFTDFYSNKIG